NGIELLRALRADEPDLPVIVMTALSESSLGASNHMLISALRLHADDFIAKPIELDELERSLDRALRVRRQREAYEIERTHAARLQAVLETATAVNHEINNPLATISASAQLLRHHLETGRAAESEGESATASVVPDAEALDHLLNVILDQCQRIADFNRKLTSVVNPVTRSSGGQMMLDVESSR
ncbi:MAG TPA: response regulator, partial [Abditibacteriaceae bacterium]